MTDDNRARVRCACDDPKCETHAGRRCRARIIVNPAYQDPWAPSLMCERCCGMDTAAIHYENVRAGRAA